MLVEVPLRNIFDASAKHPANIDWVDLSWHDCGRRFFRKKSRANKDLRFLLRLGVTLRHGDLLWIDETETDALVVNVMESETLIATPGDVDAIARLAFELGNLHVPMQLQDRQIITTADGPTQQAVEKLGVSYEIARRRFEPTLRPTPAISIAGDFEMRREE